MCFKKNMQLTETQTRYLGYIGLGVLLFFWLFLVLLAFYYFSRCAFTSGERFRLSLFFSLASIFCPFFAGVPISLNV
jgi:hypothetical protein